MLFNLVLKKSQRPKISTSLLVKWKFYDNYENISIGILSKSSHYEKF